MLVRVAVLPKLSLLDNRRRSPAAQHEAAHDLVAVEHELRVRMRAVAVAMAEVMVVVVAVDVAVVMVMMVVVMVVMMVIRVLFKEGE
ncbi:hypothetical protein ATCC90586_003558 [Pythium insidiosum]|nr:hypothetical protein ATCC90586_003558 [Pythium insidiosum]